MRFETLAVHAGGEPDPATGAVAPAIHPSTTFVHGADGSPLSGRLYAREGNPTEERLERALAALEGGAAALAFASGSAAAVTLVESLPAGATILFHRDLYSGFRDLARDFFPGWRKRARFADLGDAGELAREARGVAALWIETPTNPLLEVLDLEVLAAAARAAGALLVVDSTFATPALQQPLAHGADVVLHSTTKYLGGHSDVLGGALVFARAEPLAARARAVRKQLGATASPFASWLVLRGLRTLACRMARHSANAFAVAAALADAPRLAAVHYPGLASHPGHAVAARQMTGGFGGMLSLRVAGGRDAAIGVAARLRLFTNATSLGGVESLVEHRAAIEGAASTTPDDLLRLSVGLEHPDDLIADLRQAIAP
jgi:cystathionine gamma-synthase